MRRPGIDVAEHDPVVVAASEVVGGPSGRRVARRGALGGPESDGSPRPAPWVQVAALLVPVAAALVALGVVQKHYCFTNGWGGSAVFWHACFSDLPGEYASTPLRAQALPYGSDTPSGQPPLTGVVLWLVSLVVPAGPTGQQWFTGLWGVVAAGCAMGLVVLTASTLRRDPWRAAQVAFSPMLVTVALVSPDLLGMVLVGLGLWCWSRNRPLEAGAVLGLAVAARSYSVFVVIALGLVALRAGVVREWLRCVGAAALAWTFVVAAVEVASGGALWPYVEWLERPADYGSLLYLPALAGHPVPPGVATVIAVGGWVLALAAGAAFTLGARRRPAVAQVCVLVLVVMFVTAKSLPVQATFWLVPLAVLARIPWRVYLTWMAAECVYFVLVWVYIGGLTDTNRALPPSWYALVTVVRVAVLVAVAVHVVMRGVRGVAAARSHDRSGQAAAAVASSVGHGAGGAGVTAPDPDELAGPASGRRDRVVVAFR